MPEMQVIEPAKFVGKVWQDPKGFSFARGHNAIPVLAAELAQLVSMLPVGFVKSRDKYLMVAVTSLHQNANYFVAPDGRWLGHYTPVELRCYPFRLLPQKDSDEGVLCIDTESGLIKKGGKGNAFFDKDENPSEALGNVLNFLSEVERNRQGTQAVVDVLVDLGLIQPWPLQLNTPDGEQPVKGLYRVDEQAMNALSDADWKKLRQSGAIPLAYSQIISMHQLPMLQRAMNIHANWDKLKDADFSQPGAMSMSPSQ